MTLLFALLAPALADEPQDIANYRHDTMDIAKNHMKSSAAIVKGKVDRKGDLVLHAEGLQAVAKMNAELYPKGTGPTVVKTDALDTIWTNWKGFEEKNQAFVTATEAYVKAAKTGDLAKIGPAFQAVGKSCGGCHDDFRKDDEKK